MISGVDVDGGVVGDWLSGCGGLVVAVLALIVICVALAAVTAAAVQ